MQRVPEARLNAAMCHVRRGEERLAFDLMHEHKGSDSNSLIVSAVVHALIGQQTNDQTALTKAQHAFQKVGSSASECDTIAGRESMSSAFFLLHQMRDALLYLNSIRSYYFPPHDQSFCWNFGLASAATNHWTDAGEFLMRVTGGQRLSSRSYCLTLVRSLVFTSRAAQAFDFVADLTNVSVHAAALTLLANDAFRTGQFLVALRSFHRLAEGGRDSSSETFEAVRASAAGHLQLVVAGREPMHSLTHVLSLLSHYQQPHAVLVSDVIRAHIKQQDDQL